MPKNMWHGQSFLRATKIPTSLNMDSVFDLPEKPPYGAAPYLLRLRQTKQLLNL